MRHTVFLATAIIIASLFGSSAFATVVNVRGAPSCSIWLKGQEAERQMQGFNTGQDWLIGYLSGLAIGSGFDFWGEKDPNGFDNEEVFNWIDNYCSLNSLNDIGHGADQLFLERIRNIKKNEM